MIAVVVAVGGALLTGGVARRFVAMDPPAAAQVPTPTATPLPTPTAPSVPRLGTVRVVAVGDSVTAGSNCNCTPFPELYGTDLATTYGVKSYVENDGEGGETSADVLNDLNSDNGEQDDISDANIVLITIGANDFGPQYDQITSGTCGGDDGLDCAQDGLSQLQKNLTAIVHQIRSLRNDSSTAILMTGYWNVFEDGSVADDSMNKQGREESDALTKAVNKIEEHVAGAQDATYVDIYTPFKGSDGSSDPTDLLADDGDHPDAEGHKLIAKTLLAAGTDPLTLG